MTTKMDKVQNGSFQWMICNDMNHHINPQVGRAIFSLCLDSLLVPCLDGRFDGVSHWSLFENVAFVFGKSMCSGNIVWIY